MQALVHVTRQMLSQLSPHCSPNLVAYEISLLVWTLTLALQWMHIPAKKLTCLCNAIWLVLANSYEYYYFGNYYIKSNVSLQCHTITSKLHTCSTRCYYQNL